MSISVSSALDLLTVEDAPALDHVPKPIRWRKRAEAQRQASIVDKELSFADVIFFAQDEATLPGELVTPQSLDRHKTLQRISGLIDRFESDGASWNLDAVQKITSETAIAAKAFIARSAARLEPPKISPDGEGGLMMVWERPDSTTLAIVDNWLLHLVTNAGTPKAVYTDAIPFDGELVPPVVEAAIR